MPNYKIFFQVGPGFAIAAALYCRHYEPDKRVICVEGDSAFGFSGMEVETMVRYKLPITVVVVNNSGIYTGMDSEVYKDIQESGEVTKVYATFRYFIYSFLYLLLKEGVM